jgi:hypothetical protein
MGLNDVTQIDISDGWLAGGSTISGGTGYFNTIVTYYINYTTANTVQVNGSFLPAEGYDDNFDLGSAVRRWNDIFIGTGGLHVQGDAEFYSGSGFVNITSASGFINTSKGVHIGERVGIGIAAPSAKLHVNGSGFIGLKVESTGSAANVFVDIINPTQTWQLSTQGSESDIFRIRDVTGVATPFKIEPGSPEDLLYLDSAGNVGINTSSPSETLEVSGNISLGEMQNTESRGILFSEDDAEIMVERVDTFDWNMIFKTGTTDDAATEQMRITHDGDVGIGAASPSEKLEVAGNISLGNEINSSLILDEGDVYLQSKKMSGLRYDLLFYTVNSPVAPTEVMRLTGTGRLGIGTSRPGATLDVRGGATFNDDNADVDFRVEAAGFLNAFFVDGSDAGVFMSGLNTGGTETGNVCMITLTGEILEESDDVCTVSGIRFKENVVPMTYGINEVMALQPRFFNYKPEYKDDPNRKIGFIAEEMALIIPEVVSYQEDGQTDSVDYKMLTALLTNAIQEQQALIIELTTRIESVEAKI